MEERTKERRGDNQKHSTVKLNGKTYNGIENNMYVVIFLERQPRKHTQERKEENLAVSDSGYTVNFMAVTAHLNNVRPTADIINE